jgi:hypothetical protein
LAGLTLSTLHATFRMWFHGEEQDISRTADAVLAELNHLVCGGRRPTAKLSDKLVPANRKKKRKQT